MWRAPDARATEGAAGRWALEVVNNPGPGAATGVTLTGPASEPRRTTWPAAREAARGRLHQPSAGLPCDLGTLDWGAAARDRP